MNKWALLASFWTGVTLCLAPGLVRADLVEMQNGDRYIGKVVTLNNDTLSLQSEVLGTVRLPRAKIAHITMGPGAGTNSVRLPAQTNLLAQAPALAATNTSGDLSSMLRQLSGNTNLVRQVQTQLLSDAGPEANGKFSELLGGLMNGNVDINDLRVQAKSAADQVRAHRRELGDEAGGAVDGYLAILDKFLNETAPPAGVPPSPSGVAPPPKTTAPTHTP